MSLLALIAAASLSGPIDCQSREAVLDATRPVLAAWNAQKWEEAKSGADAVIAACGKAEGTEAAYALGSDLAYRDGDFASALSLAQNVPRYGPSPLARLAGLTAVQSAIALGDAEAAEREKLAVSAAIVAALTFPDGPIRGRMLGGFAAGENMVIAVEGDYKNGPFVRHLTFIVVPREPLKPLRTLMLTTSPASAMMDLEGVYAFDEYACDRHVLLDIIQSDHQPTYDEMRARVEAHLTQPADGISASSAGSGGACPMGVFLAPGFGS
ncbi:hypothetical protein [Phenylobacterium sp.]|uniref:hypothetical protein n=1 Tax=Phenylobacterium sp. TaxID=1871053 RepID=UPI0019A77268|nr:hypothetical protein [Phenylobacterium sp.]MBC7166664.1 hypothetical protein [Phenylobacterium sp.]